MPLKGEGLTMSKIGALTLTRRDALKTVAIAGVAPALLPEAFKIVDADKKTTLVAPPRFRVDPFWPRPLPNRVHTPHSAHSHRA